MNSKIRTKPTIKQKNPLRYGSKISEYKTKKLLTCFCNMDTAEDASEYAKVNVKTAQDMFSYFTAMAAMAGPLHPELFGGGGYFAFLGPTPQMESFTIAYDKKHGKPKNFMGNKGTLHIERIIWVVLMVCSIRQYDILEAYHFRRLGVTYWTLRKLIAPEEIVKIPPIYLIKMIWEDCCNDTKSPALSDAGLELIEGLRAVEDFYDDEKLYAGKKRAYQDLHWVLLKYGKQRFDRHNKEYEISKNTYYDEYIPSTTELNSQESEFSDNITEMMKKGVLLHKKVYAADKKTMLEFGISTFGLSKIKNIL